jgi:RsiW-degrading membrane proteinase PrsW (M82 family)
MSAGISVFIGTALARALTSTALHASSSAIMGYGLSRRIWMRDQGKTSSWVPYYLIAIGLHSLFNLLAIAGALAASDLIYLGGLLASVILVQQTIKWIRVRIEELDKQYACKPSS